MNQLKSLLNQQVFGLHRRGAGMSSVMAREKGLQKLPQRTLEARDLDWTRPWEPPEMSDRLVRWSQERLAKPVQGDRFI